MSSANNRFPIFPKRTIRRWAIIGPAGVGKSTFLSAMRQPLLVIDPDGRFCDTAPLCEMAYTISEDARVHRDPLQIYRTLSSGDYSQIGTVCLDSITAILEPMKAAAVEETRRGLHKNKSAAWVAKAEAVRLLIDSISGCGTDTAIIWHEEIGRDNKGRRQVRQTLPATERSRIVRCLNAVVALEMNGQRRFARVRWARNGASDILVEDTEGNWRGVPDRLDNALKQIRASSEQPPEANAAFR